MVHDLNKPNVPTYFIAWEGGYVSYGLTGTENQTTTGLANFETFTDQQEYLTRLLEFGITPEDEQS